LISNEYSLLNFAEGFVSVHKKTFGRSAQACLPQAGIYDESEHACPAKDYWWRREVNRSARQKFSAREQIPEAK